MCYLLSYATMKIYPNITAAFDSAEIRFLLACDDAIGEASAKKKTCSSVRTARASDAADPESSSDDLYQCDLG